MQTGASVLRRLLALLVLCGLLALGGVYLWLNAPMKMATAQIDLQVEPGSSPRAVAQELTQLGVDVSPDLLWYWFKWSGKAKQIRAGSYEIMAGTTPAKLLEKLVNGDVAQRAVTFVEGWNFQQVRAALAKAPDLRLVAQGYDGAALMAALGRPGVHPEGRFFPDTYTYTKGSTDLEILARALKIMDKQLAAAWANRAPNAAVKTPQDALILASIVEKETGLPTDRPLVSGVFNNRLRIGMRLQTDPTVIYGLGSRFDGDLRKADLLTDTPYNTYTRNGLPPTPIAMPGKAALRAAVQPATTKALYFVARGDGSSQFSETLEAHNRAVNQYILGR